MQLYDSPLLMTRKLSQHFFEAATVPAGRINLQIPFNITATCLSNQCYRKKQIMKFSLIVYSTSFNYSLKNMQLKLEKMR